MSVANFLIWIYQTILYCFQLIITNYNQARPWNEFISYGRFTLTNFQENFLLNLDTYRGNYIFLTCILLILFCFSFSIFGYLVFLALLYVGLKVVNIIAGDTITISEHISFHFPLNYQFGAVGLLMLPYVYRGIINMLSYALYALILSAILTVLHASFHEPFITFIEHSTGV